jgi:hypothetical protein
MLEKVPIMLPHLHGILHRDPHDHVTTFFENPPLCETIVIIAAKVTSIILTKITLAATTQQPRKSTL